MGSFALMKLRRRGAAFAAAGLGLLLGAGMAFSAPAVANAAPGDVVQFSDLKLAECVRLKAGKPIGSGVTEQEMLGLTSLQCAGLNITSLSGLEYAENLTALQLPQNKISNLGPLSGLTDLTELILYGNEISSLSPLSGLNRVQRLSLSDNQIVDLAPLRTLTALEDLNLARNQFTDLAPLSTLTSLRNLVIAGNQVSDVSPLASLIEMRVLNMATAQIEDISPLSSMTSMEFLDAEFNQISDISPLSGISTLNTLWISHNTISDLRPVSGLTNLTTLLLGDNRISDVGPLADIAANLEYLDLYTNQISDVAPLAGLSNINYLHIDDNRIADFRPLSSVFATARTLDGSNQRVLLSSVSVNVPVANPVRDAEGGIPAMDDYCADASCQQLIYPVPGTAVEAFWNVTGGGPDGRNTFGGALVRDVTVLPVSYPVVFDSRGGTAVSGVSVVAGGVVEKPSAPTRDAFDFVGWYTTPEGGSAYDFASPVNAPLTLYAVWAPSPASGGKPKPTEVALAQTGASPSAGPVFGAMAALLAGAVITTLALSRRRQSTVE